MVSSVLLIGVLCDSILSNTTLAFYVALEINERIHF